MTRISKSTCSVDGCARKCVARQLCNMHYLRWKKSHDIGRAEPYRDRHEHRMTNHPLYSVWQGMKSRCNNPRDVNYPLYGGRGIVVCDRWRDFSLFVKDMGRRPDGMTLDRIDGDGNYEPSNCRWATKSEQNANRRQNPNRYGYRGVVARYGRYVGQVEWQGKKFYTILADTPEEAAALRDQWAICIQGDSATLNFN